MIKPCSFASVHPSLLFRSFEPFCRSPGEGIGFVTIFDLPPMATTTMNHTTDNNNNHAFSTDHEDKELNIFLADYLTEDHNAPLVPCPVHYLLRRDEVCFLGLPNLYSIATHPNRS